jgi:beta-glucosidase-like glycosyl hydrolase
MSTFKLELHLTSEDLLKAVAQLSQSEIEEFVSQVIAIQAQKKSFRLPKIEAELLIKINQGISGEMQNHYERLMAKREAEALTQNEYEELLNLSQEIEKLQAQRIEYLAELARLRGISLTKLMENLGIQTQMYA